MNVSKVKNKDKRMTSIYIAFMLLLLSFNILKITPNTVILFFSLMNLNILLLYELVLILKKKVGKTRGVRSGFLG